MATKDAHAFSIKAQMKRGYVLHIDPDYLLTTYGDVVFGPHPSNTVGPRYAMCVEVEGDVTFWTLLTGQDHDFKQLIPDSAKRGAWAENPKTSYFSQDQLWVATKDMIVEAHFEVNSIKSTFRHSYVEPSMIDPWPSIPATYPKAFTPIGRKTALAQAMENATVIVNPGSGASIRLGSSEPFRVRHTAPPAIVVETKFIWKEWIQEMRTNRGLSVREAADAIGLSGLTGERLRAIEAPSRCLMFTPDEREAWGKAMAPMDCDLLHRVPVMSESAVQRREVLRRHRLTTAAAKTRNATSTHVGDDPKVAETSQLHCEPPVELSRPDSKARLLEEGNKLLNNPRLTESELRGLVSGMRESLVNLLLGA